MPVKTLVTRAKYLLKDLLPVPNISPVTFAGNLFRDGIDLALSRREPMTPPVRWMFDGSTDPSSFKRAGDEFLGHLIRYGDLKASDRVLDVGSGIGRGNTADARRCSRASISFPQSSHGAEWTDEVSQMFGRIKATLERRGTQTEDFDAAIAAHALALDATLVTANVNHMIRVPGLRVEDWS